MTTWNGHLLRVGEDESSVTGGIPEKGLAPQMSFPASEWHSGWKRTGIGAMGSETKDSSDKAADGKKTDMTTVKISETSYVTIQYM